MKYGDELIKDLESELETLNKSLGERAERVFNCETDWDDCFLSQRVESRSASVLKEKIALLKSGGTAWFKEFATLDGTPVEGKWCDTRFGGAFRVVMPDGEVVWTTATTKKGLAKRGLKDVMCRRPAWYAFKSSGNGLMGVYTGDYVLFPSDVNYATGEPAESAPIEIMEVE